MLQLSVMISCFLSCSCFFLAWPYIPAYKQCMCCKRYIVLSTPFKHEFDTLPPVLTSWLLQGLLPIFLPFTFLIGHTYTLRCIFIPRFPTQPTTFSVSLPSVLMKNSAHSSETLVTTHQITLCHILADQSLKTNLTPHVGCIQCHDMALNTSSCSQYQ